METTVFSNGTWRTDKVLSSYDYERIARQITGDKSYNDRDGWSAVLAYRRRPCRRGWRPPWTRRSGRRWAGPPWQPGRGIRRREWRRAEREAKREWRKWERGAQPTREEKRRRDPVAETDRTHATLAASAPARAGRASLSPRGKLGTESMDTRVYLIDKLKISEIGDKREYRIYRNSIGDREIFSGQNLEKKLSFLCRNELRFFFKPSSLKNYT